MTLEEMLFKFKKVYCENCKGKDKCQGIILQIDGKLKCVNN